MQTLPVFRIDFQGGVITQRAAQEEQRDRFVFGQGWIGYFTANDGRAEVMKAFLQVNVIARHIQNGDGHLVLCQGAGFIGTDDGHRTQRFHGGQFTDQRIAFEHALRAQRQRDGNDRRQGLQGRLPPPC